MPVIKNKDGQMIIVSEGIDVEDINFDDIIDNTKTDLGKMAEALQGSLVKAETLQKATLDDLSNESQNKKPEKQEPIWVQFSFLEKIFSVQRAKTISLIFL